MQLGAVVDKAKEGGAEKKGWVGLGGIVSGSMHGWWWLVWGFAGSLLGTRLRAVLSMDPPLPPRRTTIRA